jgi:hypothetical protein
VAVGVHADDTLGAPQLEGKRRHAKVGVQLDNDVLHRVALFGAFALLDRKALDENQSLEKSLLLGEDALAGENVLSLDVAALA